MSSKSKGFLSPRYADFGPADIEQEMKVVVVHRDPDDHLGIQPPVAPDLDAVARRVLAAVDRELHSRNGVGWKFGDVDEEIRGLIERALIGAIRDALEDVPCDGSGGTSSPGSA